MSPFEATFQDRVELLPGAIVVMSRDGWIVLVNVKTEQMSGFIDTAIDVTRRIATQWRLAVLESLGLVATIEW